MKAAAFQFYTKDFLSSSFVQRLQYDEVGIYVLLLVWQWEDGGLDPNTASLHEHFPRMDLARFEQVWAKLKVKFKLCADGLLRNPRIEEERQKLRALPATELVAKKTPPVVVRDRQGAVFAIWKKETGQTNLFPDGFLVQLAQLAAHSRGDESLDTWLPQAIGVFKRYVHDSKNWSGSSGLSVTMQHFCRHFDKVAAMLAEKKPARKAWNDDAPSSDFLPDFPYEKLGAK